MVSYCPNMTFVEADKQPLIEWDVRLAHRYLTTGSLAPQVGKYGYLSDFSGVIKYVEEEYAKTGKPVRIAVDTETMGLIPWLPGKEIVTVQITPKKGYAFVVKTLGMTGHPLEALKQQLKWLLNSDKVVTVGANLKYDLLWFRVKWGLTCSNFKFDTLLMGSLLNENRSNSLNLHAKVYTPLGGYDDPFNLTHDKGKMDEHIVKDPEGFLTYAGGDTDACLQVAEAQFAELANEPPCLKPFYVHILHPAARAFENVEHRGMVVDMHEYKQLEADLKKEQEGLEHLALSMIPARLKLKHEDKGVTLTRKALLSDFLFTPQGLNLKPLMLTAKSGEPKTDKAHLLMYADHPVAGPFIKAYREWNSVAKTLSTYVHGFLTHLRPDGRFHPTYMFFAGSVFGGSQDGGTNTGRLSAVDPAVQTIPKHTKWAKRIRKCFPAPPGMVFWQADFSQGELRIAADLADEQTMLHAYTEGLDLHVVTGAKLASMELDEFIALGLFPEGSPEKLFFDRYRQIAKSANFGLLYGMGNEGFQEYARISTGGKLKLTIEEATDTREAFFALYSALRPWHNAYKDHARQHGWVASPLGRVRHLPLIKSKLSEIRSKAERQAVNAPVQGCLSDMNLWSSAIIEQNWGGDTPNDIWVAGATHDSIYGYCGEHNKAEQLGRIVDVMQTLPMKQAFGWDPQVFFSADIEQGPTFADLAKYKLAA
jgi:DNA polymerase I-like protein with 3'-5' exonuclease and polymerase domains